MHRDIKCEHLCLDTRGRLCLIDWGLSTKLADNAFQTPYVITFPYRPLEIFLACKDYINDEGDSIDIMLLTKSGPATLPFCYPESDLYSFAWTMIISLCQTDPLHAEYSLPMRKRHAMYVRNIFVWHGMWQELVDALVMSNDDLFAMDREPTFSTVLAREWRRTWERGVQSTICPFGSLQEAMARAPVKTMEMRRDSILMHLLPEPWVRRVWDKWGAILLSMGHLNPDARPTSTSLCQVLCEGKTLVDWHRVTMAEYERSSMLCLQLSPGHPFRSRARVMTSEMIMLLRDALEFWRRNGRFLSSILSDQGVPSVL